MAGANADHVDSGLGRSKKEEIKLDHVDSSVGRSEEEVKLDHVDSGVGPSEKELELLFVGRSEEELKLLFDDWMVEHKKIYDGVAEKEKRFEIFKNTLRRIDEHNSAAAEHGFWLGINPFSAMTDEEWNLRSCEHEDEDAVTSAPAAPTVTAVSIVTTTPAVTTSK